jgi:hypothetical protein
MKRGSLGGVVGVCLAIGIGGGACASRKEAAEPQAQPTGQKEAPAVGQKETPGALACSLSVASRFKVGEPVMVRFQLTNSSAQPVYVLGWNTPFEGLRNSFLQVTRDGTDIPYQGPMLKRGEPTAEDYVSIAPGASADAQVEASLAYDFSQPGHYRIAFRDELLDVATNKPELPHTRERFQPRSVQCPAVETTIVTP